MLGRNIKKYRLLSGMSLREMADKLGVSHQTIKKYEEGIITPNSERIIQISKLFNVNISDLLNAFIVPKLKFENFRKQSKMSKTKEKGLYMLISDEIAKYLEVLSYANENRFTLAHELGHLILDFDNDIEDKEKERYCDYFASCLLMPSKAMKKEFEFNNICTTRNVSINEIILIAKEYKVSINAVIMRLNTLGIIDDNQKRNLFILLSKAGLRTKQLKLINEHPTRRDKIVFRLEAEKIISTDEAVKYLGVTTDEFFKSDFCN